MFIVTVEGIAAICQSPVKVVSDNGLGGRAFCVALAEVLAPALHGEGTFKTQVNNDDVYNVTGKTTPKGKAKPVVISEQVEFHRAIPENKEGVIIVIERVSTTVSLKTARGIRGYVLIGTSRKPFNVTI